MKTFGVFGKGMLKNNALLKSFLQDFSGESVQVQRLYPVISQTDDITAMLGWGRKKSYRRASRFAHHHDLVMLTLEDGFLRSLTSGKSSRHACSMVIDPVGIYFDAKMPSYLEQLIHDTVLTVLFGTIKPNFLIIFTTMPYISSSTIDIKKDLNSSELLDKNNYSEYVKMF